MLLMILGAVSHQSIEAKGYPVGRVYDDVLAMTWFFLELIAKSMALEQARSFSHNLLLRSQFSSTRSNYNRVEIIHSEDVPPMQLKEGVFRCAVLFNFHEHWKKGLSLTKHLNSSLAFFCYVLLSIIESRQVFELVGDLLLLEPSLRNFEIFFGHINQPGLELISTHTNQCNLPSDQSTKKSSFLQGNKTLSMRN